MSALRMNEIVKMIRKSGSVDLVLNGETVTVGFQDAGKPGTLTMLGGGYYTVRTTDGRTFEIAKGQLVEVSAALTAKDVGRAYREAQIRAEQLAYCLLERATVKTPADVNWGHVADMNRIVEQLTAMLEN